MNPDMSDPFRTRAFWVALCASLVLAATCSSVAVAGECSTALPYPGDDATKVALAEWMANGARARGIPGELPVMGALVASGLANLRYGDADSVGFFAMRTGIWNTGRYQGFPEHPDLQLMWFIDYALTAREGQIAAGNPAYGLDPAGWGTWIADVLRPPEQYRGRYQLRLTEARELIGASCAGWPPPPAPPPAAQVPPTAPPPPIPQTAAPSVRAPVPDTSAPLVQLGGSLRQPALDRGAIVVTVRCPTERCLASATGALAIPGRTRPLLLRATPRQVASGQRVRLRLPMSLRMRRIARRALLRRSSLRATITVRVSDGAGNRTAHKRTVLVTRHPR